MKDSVFQDKSIMITGGTGSFGKHFLSYLIEKHQPKRIAIYSRDELKQFEVKSRFKDRKNIRWFIGDIRDKERLTLALMGVDFVIHAAALKQVDTGEYNPSEFIKTNIIGSENLIEASIKAGVRKVVALSTDKASSPINLYGATKLTADKLFIAANNYGHSKGTIFSVVRYGNVAGSRGSVIPFFQKLSLENKSFPITDIRMTRFCITLDQACKFVVDSFNEMMGGELFVPRIPSIRIVDIARVINPQAKIEVVGIRPGEKLHEEMISTDDSWRTTKFKNKYIVSPVAADWGYQGAQGEKVKDGFSYRSDSNDLWMTDFEIGNLIQEINARST